MLPYQQGEEHSPQILHYPQNENIGVEDVKLGEQVDQRNQQPNQIFGAPNTTHSNTFLSSDEKKIFRKEIERQRRQQMSTLHASLRSLLPLELIKGKRSMSDHFNGAVNYIQHLKSNIRDLSVKRDKLKRSSSDSTEDQGTDQSSENTTHVSVRSYLEGVEIAITSEYGDEGFVLSRLLEAVVEEGLDVESCFSTRKDGRLFTTIHCQASYNAAYIDQAGLQQKLNDVILCLKE